jgi:predicted nicotinamide N-methyase
MNTSSATDEDVDSEAIITWNDAQIRWTDDMVRRDDDDDDDAPPDVFAPNPHQTFTFQNIQLHGYTYESDQTWNSTGLTIWKASEYLSQYLLSEQQQRLLPDKRVLELGAGLGLCGIVAHRLLQARTVYVTDGDSDVLKVLNENIQANREASYEDESKRQQHMISGHQLLWGAEYAQQFLQRMRRIQPHPENDSLLLFDVILAADVVYVPQVIAPLFETVQTLLEPVKGVFLLAFARRMVDVTLQDVLQEATQAGLVYEQRSTETDTAQGLYLYAFRRKPSNENETIGQKD